VIGRRDFVASVFSRSFLFFLLGPLIIMAVSAGFGSITQNVARESTRTSVAVIATDADRQAIAHARERLVTAVGDQAVPNFTYATPAADVKAQIRTLLDARDERVSAVLSGGLAAPRLSGSVSSGDGLYRQVSLAVDEARRERAAAGKGIALDPIDIPVDGVSNGAGAVAAVRAVTATIGQFLLFFLTVLLSGMLLSNLLEEKSNKIIEVLAAAAPVDAIFLGKVVSMLAISLTGIAIWGLTAALAVGAMRMGPGSLPQPAIGWPLYGAMIVVYFCVNYLLLGALFLGIGSQANSVREVQTLSMPITVGQMLIFALAMGGGGDIAKPLGLAAAIFPFSSPIAMVGVAAQNPSLWLHALALLWQGLWVWLVVRFGAALFRRNVLKSGPAFRRKRRRA
jgi:ABC-2 type transport system permease protein